MSRLASIEGLPEDGKAALSVKNFVFDRPVDEMCIRDRWMGFTAVSLWLLL